MSRLRLVKLVLFALIAVAASQAFAGIPSTEYSTAAMATEASLTLFNLPDGSGADMTQARDVTGTAQDATITLEVRDTADYVIPALAAEDLWLVSSAGGLYLCTDGTIADGPTDTNGIATFSGPFNAGGSSVDDNDLCQVTLAGDPLASQLGMTLYFNSADLNGDGVVNLLDVTVFIPLYSNPGVPRSVDLDYDGIKNILDVTKLTTAWGKACP